MIMRRPAMACTRRRYLAWTLAALALLGAGGCTVVKPEPKAAFDLAPDVFYSGLPVTFDGSVSFAGGETITSYAWRFSDGATAGGAVVGHVFSNPGSYSVHLTIVTDLGTQDHITREVTVLRGLIVPTDYSRIQDAIDSASDGDTIIVLPGTYVETLAIRGKSITLRSRDPEDASVVQSTIIRGSEYGRSTVTIGEGSEAVLAGFTIVAGPKTGSICPTCAGVVYIREASPTLTKNRIMNSTEGGIVVYESAAQIVDNVIANNSSGGSGGGIVVDSYGVAPRILNNVFEGNTAPSGGAIFITASAAPQSAMTGRSAARTVVAGNTFRDNVATQPGGGGGAIYVEFHGNLYLDDPDSNTYVNNQPNDVFYVVPPSP
jgi:PKD repeat protein